MAVCIFGALAGGGTWPNEPQVITRKEREGAHACMKA